jgi:hypothetical protein
MQLPLGSYHYALNTDGSCCRFVLVDINVFSNELLPPTPNDATTVVGSAENAGDMTTRDMSTFLFPDTYLYFPPFTAPNNCCVLGFHGYDAEPGSAANGWREKRYVLNYSSWISPGLFGGGLHGRHGAKPRAGRDVQRSFHQQQHAVVAGTERQLPGQPRDWRRDRGPVECRYCDHPERLHLSPSERSARPVVRGRDAVDGDQWGLQLPGQDSAADRGRVADVRLRWAALGGPPTQAGGTHWRPAPIDPATVIASASNR